MLKLFCRELLVQPLHSSDVFLMLGPSRALICTTGGPSVANEGPTKFEPGYSCVPIRILVRSFIEAS